MIQLGKIGNKLTMELMTEQSQPLLYSVNKKQMTLVLLSILDTTSRSSIMCPPLSWINSLNFAT